MDQQTMLGCHVEMVLPRKPLDSLDEDHKKYISSVEGFDGKILMLTMPMLKGRFAPLHKGERYDVYIFIQTKIYQSMVVVEGAIRDGDKIILLTKALTDFKKYERREFFRLSFSQDIFYRVLEKDLIDIYRKYISEGKELLQDGFLKGVSVDLSAGGMKFTSSSRLHPEDVILIQFKVVGNDGEDKTYTVLAHVIESVNHPGHGLSFIHRAAFEINNQKLQESLVSFIFREQRRALRKSDS